MSLPPDSGWMTGNPEIISSPAGLVPTNALVIIYFRRQRRVPFKEVQSPQADLSLLIGPTWITSGCRRSGS